MKSFNVTQEAIVEISDVVVNLDEFNVVYFVFNDSKIVNNIVSMYNKNQELNSEKKIFCKLIFLRCLYLNL